MKYLFIKVTEGRYSKRSLGCRTTNATQTAKIKEQVSLRMLQQSFAIQFLENAVDISYIHQLLRHSYIKISEQLTHVINTAQMILVSPLGKINRNSTTRNNKTLLRYALASKSEIAFSYQQKIVRYVKQIFTTSNNELYINLNTLLNVLTQSFTAICKNRI